MVEANALNRAKSVYDDMCAILDRKNWNYQKHDEDLFITFTVSGDDIPMDFVFLVDAEHQLLRVYSKLPFIVPEDKRVELAIATCAASYKLNDGSFDYDVKKGTIMFRLTVSFRESKIGDDLFTYLVRYSGTVVDKYNDRFFAVGKGIMSVDDFIAQEEKTSCSGGNMTLVEFFEKDAVENLCSSLAKAPQRVILIGDKAKLMKKHIERYQAILSDRKKKVDFIFRTVNKNKMQTIIDALSEIVEEYDDCVFDLTGGEDLYLVATGIVFEKYKDRNIQMHRFNIRNNTVIDCDQDGQLFMENEAPMLSIEENIRLYGGDIVRDNNRENKTFKWDMSTDFINDINKMWNICRQNPRLWNTQIGVFAAAERLAGCSGDLTINVPQNYLKDDVERDGTFITKRNIFEELFKKGLLKDYSYDGDIFSVTYKNEQVRRCLTISGQVLEMKVFLAAIEALDSDGAKTYNDVMNGVVIDWDGDISTDQHSYDTENEVDIIMMHGMVPVFVSCKNGQVDADELYKLNSVAARFGGKYAKKVLVATSLDDSAASNYLRQRAEDMGIRLIEGYSNKGEYKKFTEMTDVEINRVIRSLWSN